MSMDQLIEKIREKNNPSVAGLDPKLDYIPAFIKEQSIQKYGKTFEAAADAILTFNKGLIDAICDVVPAIKPQCAYYEMYSWEGVRALHETIAYAHEKGMYVITDGKRNDIGSTMEAYAAGHLGSTDLFGSPMSAFGADALTVNAYLGTDGILPMSDLIVSKGKAIFALVKTSNPSSGELQDRALASGETVYAAMGDMCEKWGEPSVGKFGYSGVGAVVGATYPQQLTELRQRLPHTFFLVPGYGAQGGGAQGLVGAFDAQGLGAIVNSSRAVMCAYKKENCDEREYAQAARREVIRMRDDINGAINGR